MKRSTQTFKYPGIRAAMDGNTAIVHCERESSDAAGAYPITPSTQMGEYWAEAAASGHLNISGRPLIFIEPEGEHAAAAVTAGLAMTGLRAANFSASQGVAYMHESLYAAVGKRLTYVLNIGTRALAKSTLNVHAAHDDYHCIDDTGFFQLFARDVQHAADLNIIAHRIAELALNPGLVAQDGFLTTHLIESLLAPERALIAEYLGRPDDSIACPTPSQRIIYGETRRRIPELWDVDNPVVAGLVENQDSYMQSVAAQRPFFFDHIERLAEQAFEEFHALTGRRYARVLGYRWEDADYLILGQGSVVPTAEAVADYLRDQRKLNVGVVNLVMFRPFPGDLLGRMLQGKRGVAVLERTDQPLAADLPVMRELRATLSKCLENGARPDAPPFPDLPVYRRQSEAPALYSGCFGLGSRDLQPEGLIGAVENMLPGAPQRRFFYLGIDFLRRDPLTPKQKLHQETIAAGYPRVAELAVHGSENPNLLPSGSVTVRLHSIGGWGVITMGKNLALTLFELLGGHIKANPKYGAEKKGQPTTYYLAAAPEPIRINCEYAYVDAVLSPDPNVFRHTNALAGLREGGVFVLQSDQPTPEQVAAAIPPHYRRVIAERDIRVYALDAFRIAREEATDPDLQMRMQGMAFQGAFFAATTVMRDAGLDEGTLLDAIRTQLEHKFGGRGARVVEDNLEVVKRGFDEVRAIAIAVPGETAPTLSAVGAEPALPRLVRELPLSHMPLSDIHRFWEQTGNFYLRGLGSENLADPFIALGVMPAASALFRDLTAIRFRHPEWIPENCTGCGKCYTVCPDTAIPGLVTEVPEVLETVVRRLRKRGQALQHLPKAARTVAGKLQTLLADAEEDGAVRAMMEEAVERTIAEADADAQAALAEEFRLFWDELGDFQFALTRPHFTIPERRQAGDGGLFSVTINPATCKGCQECIAVCEDDALRPVAQTDESVSRLRRNWEFWLDLPNTPARYIQVRDLEGGVGVLESILLSKDAYLAFTSGDGACMGCTEKTVLHLFIATVESLMQPRIREHVAYLDQLIARLEQHIELKLVEAIDVEDTQALAGAIGELREGDLTLARLAAKIETLHETEPVDREWLEWVTGVLTRVKDLRARYEAGTGGRARTAMGIVNATGCSSVWGSTYPFNPYPFPWANHLFQDSASMAMGVFEGHMAKMAEGFKAIRMAEIELSGGYAGAEHAAIFNYFDWRQFSDAEYRLCPPVVVVGGDGALYDIGFQNLSRAMMSGKPIKVVVLDTQVYSNTGGQACTSGFQGQVSDMAPFGAVTGGKQEVRKEIGLIAMAHRTTYVMQSTIAYAHHMIEGFIEGLMSRRPALFNCYSACQPEHGIGDDMGHHQARLAAESRAYPLFRYDPDRGPVPADCLDLDGNPAPQSDWPAYQLTYREGNREKVLELPLTFADFAMTEGRFRKHFRTAPRDTWHESMIPLAEYLDLDAGQREGKFPFIWSVDSQQRLGRLLVDQTMVASCEDRRDFWTTLKALAGIHALPEPEEDMEERLRGEIIAKLSAGLAQLAGGEAAAAPEAAAEAAPATPAAEAAGTTAADHLAPWIDSDECTACGECIKINPEIFTYDERKRAYIKDPQGGPYRDLVKAAERCTAQVIHPGLPKRSTDKDIEQWIERAEPFNR